MTGGHLQWATNPKTGGHCPEKRPLRQVTPQVLLNTAGVFTHTLALPSGVLEVVLRGDVAQTPTVAYWWDVGLVLSGKWSEVATFSLSPSHWSVTTHTRSAGLWNTGCVSAKPTEDSHVVVVGDNVEMKLLVFARVTVLAAKTFQGCHP